MVGTGRIYQLPLSHARTRIRVPRQVKIRLWIRTVLLTQPQYTHVGTQFRDVPAWPTYMFPRMLVLRLVALKMIFVFSCFNSPCFDRSSKDMQLLDGIMPSTDVT